MAPVVLVIGSSGNVGEATLRELEKHQGKLVVHAGVRDPAKADKLKSLHNVQLVKADSSDKATLLLALKGVDRVFFVTPGAENRAELGNTAVDAAKEAGVKHIVVVSVLTAELTGTIFGKQFTQLEQKVKDSGLNYTILRLPIFIENNLAHIPTVKAQGVFYGPAKAERKFTPISVPDVGRAAAAILLDPSKHVNKTYSLTTAPFSHKDLAAAFTASLGKPVTYVQVPYEAAFNAFLSVGLQAWQVNGVLELFNLVDAESPVVNHANNDYEAITGQKPTTIQQWVEAHKQAFL